jgi:ribosomal protein S12 methylthiotransferase accessory factor
MLLDSLSVETMDQHAALYAHPAARPRADFLSGGGPGVTLESVAAQAAWRSSDDLSADLDELVGRYLATGLDVIAVDTTSTEQAAGRFASAKVIVPGTLPMTFGHRFRRTTGLPRLHTVPRLLGFRDRDTPLDELNPFPHPFS